MANTNKLQVVMLNELHQSALTRSVLADRINATVIRNTLSSHSQICVRSLWRSHSAHVLEGKLDSDSVIRVGAL